MITGCFCLKFISFLVECNVRKDSCSRRRNKTMKDSLLVRSKSVVEYALKLSFWIIVEVFSQQRKTYVMLNLNTQKSTVYIRTFSWRIRAYSSRVWSGTRGCWCEEPLLSWHTYLVSMLRGWIHHPDILGLVHFCVLRWAGGVNQTHSACHELNLVCSKMPILCHKRCDCWIKFQ